MKTNNLLFPFSKALKSLAAIALLGASLSQFVLAVNIEPGVECPPDDGCTVCGEDFPADAPECEETPNALRT